MTTEYASISPNSGHAFAQWSEPEDREIAQALSKLAKGTAALTSDVALRKDVLSRCISALETAQEELVELAIQEVGKTLPEAEGEVPYAESFFETSMQLLQDYPFLTQASDGREIKSVPRGVGLLITPYNDPIAGLTRKIGPCLAAGAGAIVKPSELGVQTALILAQSFKNAGLGDYISFLPLTQSDRIEALMAQPEIGTVSFTGSTEVGLKVATCAAANAKSYVGELGGTNPFVIFEDADLEKAVDDLVTRKIKAAGQACSAQNIVYAEASVAKEVGDRVAAALVAVSYGAASETVTMGPVRTMQSVNRLSKVGERLLASGAKQLCGGIEPVKKGQATIAAPTAYAISDPKLLETQELFGPLLGITPFADRNALRSRLSHNRQPLVLYVYCQDTQAARDFADGLRFGSVGINTTGIQSPDAPTGGFGLAGIGREGGTWGLAEFLTTINFNRAG